MRGRGRYGYGWITGCTWPCRLENIESLDIIVGFRAGGTKIVDLDDQLYRTAVKHGRSEGQRPEITILRCDQYRCASIQFIIELNVLCSVRDTFRCYLDRYLRGLIARDGENMGIHDPYRPQVGGGKAVGVDRKKESRGMRPEKERRIHGPTGGAGVDGDSVSALELIRDDRARRRSERGMAKERR